MTTIVTGGAQTPKHGDSGHWPSAAATWTDEQTAYALFLKNACVRLEVIADEIGIEPDRIDDFVCDALVVIHHARHTRARGRQRKAWVEAIAYNLGRKRRWRAVVRGRRRPIFWLLWPFVRDHRDRGGAETKRLSSTVISSATTM